MELLWVSLLNFVQAGVSTWYVRAANCSDVNYHRLVGYLYNILWCVANGWFFISFLDYVNNSDYLLSALLILLYSVSRAEGAALSQWVLIRWEKGNKRVGSTYHASR